MNNIDENTKKWVKKNDSLAPQDVHTLIRNIFIHKCVSVFGFKLFQVLSKTGEFIFILLFANDVSLKKEADRIRFNLELEVGAIDLLSMEPIDENLRPLRFITKSKPERVSDREKVLEPLFDILFQIDDLSILFI